MMKGVFCMCKKICFSITEQVDNYLTNAKNETGFTKSSLLSMLVSRYGEEMLQEVKKYGRKENTAKVFHTMQ